LLLGVAIVALRPSWRRLVLVVIVAAVGVGLNLLAAGLPVVDTLAVAAVLAALVAGTMGARRRVLLLVAVAAGALAVFRAACYTVPTAWSADAALGYVLGRLGGLVGGQPPSLGGSLGGLDLVLLMGVFYVGWLRATPAPRRGRAVSAAAAILIVQAVYLIALAHATPLAAALPTLTLPESLDPGQYRPTDWNVLAELRGCIPWNMPLLAALLQAVVATAMLRWTRLEVSSSGSAMPTLRLGQGSLAGAAPSEAGQSGGAGPQPKTATGQDNEDATKPRRRGWLLVAAVLVAVATGFLAAWPPGRGDLSGKTVVAYRDAYGDWDVPTHETLEPERSGVYGLLASLVADLGGQWLVSDALSKEDLDRADVVLVIQPPDRWPEDRRKRLEEFVREGGSVLVVAGPMVEEEAGIGADGQATAANKAEQPPADQALRPVNELVRFAGMAFRCDVARSSGGTWNDAIAGSTHPAVFGLSQRTLGLSLQGSSTIEANWPSRAILIGRWGWSEPGSTAPRPDAVPDTAGQWGDLVLAAERPVGRGTVVTLGSYWCLTNLGMADGHELTGRLLGYLARRPANPQAMWRQVLALLGYLGLFVLIVWRASAVRVATVCLTLAAVLVTATCYARTAGPVPAQPQGNSTARPIAYVDASHLELGNDRPWANDSMDGFLLTLARNGYLPLKLHRWDPERLKQASLLVVMGPARPFSAGELREIREFAEQGGHVICMVGATEASAARTLLDEFEFEPRRSPSPTGATMAEAEPMGQFPEEFGRFATPYGEDRSPGRVWFFQGWPIDCKDNHAWKLVWGYGQQPIVIYRSLDKGSITLIGDSRFALNFNHGYYDGRIIESASDNAHFWRWILSWIKGQREWIPPDRAREARQRAWHGGREVWR